MKYNTNAVTTTNTGSGNASATASSALFCEQVNTVTNLFENWNDCERTVVMYALLKRLRYPSLKFLQYSIDSNLTQSLGSSSQSNLSAIVIDISANNPSYLLNLVNAYRTFQLGAGGSGGDATDTLSSSSSDKDSMPCFGSDFQITHCDERKQSLPVYSNKEDILHEVLSMLPLLKPGNEEAKMLYLSLIPCAVKDTMRQIVPTELVQQIFSYLLIHPAISSDDRRTLNVWLRHLEEYIQSAAYAAIGQQQHQQQQHQQQQQHYQQNLLLQQPHYNNTGGNISQHINPENGTTMLSSVSSASSSNSASSSSSAGSSSSASTASVSSSIGGSIASSRNADWQTIAPPTKVQQQHLLLQHKSKPLHDWSSVVAGQSIGIVPIVSGGGINIADKLCDNLNGITLNELASSQNSLGLTIGGGVGSSADIFGPSLVNGVAAAAAIAATPPSIFGNSATNPIMNIISNNNNNCMNNLNADDNDNSFSKNGTEILDFEPSTSNASNDCNSSIAGTSAALQQHSQQQQPENFHPEPFGYAAILMNNFSDQVDSTRWSLDSKLAALKTRRSNSLTTQAISSSASSSSNSSVNTVNENCSNSNENLSQFANKPRSFSLSIEHSRGALTNSGSETRLDDFKPNYVKFHTRNLGMSSIGLWLKSLRLHKYIELFKNITYEEMLQISEDYLQSLGVTKGASHKLALCIEKLKERYNHMTKMEQDLLTGQLKLQAAVEELTNIVLTPMKPIESIKAATGEDNVALKFIKVVDLVCSLFQKDTYAAQDEDSTGVLLWILERSIHNEAFANHVNHLKDLKFKLSKLKISIAPKMHHAKNLGSNGNLNKPRWNGKSRKCDGKNGSNDRINHRKNSNDMLNFSLSCLQQQHHSSQQQQQQQQQHANDYDKFNHSNQQQQQYKSSSYPNFINTPQQQQHQQIKQHQHHHQQQQQQQIQQQLLQQHAHFPALPQQQQQQQVSQQHQQQHRRSLNNLVVVNNAAQQPQKILFKPGQAVLSTTATTSIAAAAENATQREHHAIKNQQRKASLTNQQVSNNLTVSFTPAAPQSGVVTTTNTDKPTQQQLAHQQQHQQPKKTMAAVVMVSSDDLGVAQQLQQQQILINNNSSHMLNNSVICAQQQQQHLLQQQQQQLQLLAAAAAAVGSSCSLNNSSTGSSINNNLSSNQSSDCNDSLSVNATNQLCTPHITNINLTPKDVVYHASPHSSASVTTMNDMKSLEQLETLCLQMTEQAIN